MFNKVFDTGIPEYNVVAYFWENLRNDIQGRGCLQMEVPPALRGLTYKRRATLERRMLQEEAKDFLFTEDFIGWAELSGADPHLLREELLHEYDLNS